MKIVYKPIAQNMVGQYRNIFLGYKPFVESTTTCCDTMARSLNNTILYQDIPIRLKSSSPDSVATGTECSLRLFLKDSYQISFCPFCGDRIAVYRSGDYLDNAEEKPDTIIGKP